MSPGPCRCYHRPCLPLWPLSLHWVAGLQFAIGEHAIAASLGVFRARRDSADDAIVENCLCKLTIPVIPGLFGLTTRFRLDPRSPRRRPWSPGLYRCQGRSRDRIAHVAQLDARGGGKKNLFRSRPRLPRVTVTGATGLRVPTRKEPLPRAVLVPQSDAVMLILLGLSSTTMDRQAVR